jgi:hypothetical protein
MAFHQATPFVPAQRPTTTRNQDEAFTPITNTFTHDAREWVSRLSDFGSLNTVARSGREEDEYFDENEDLDSLDDGLHAFREPSMFTSSQRLADLSGGSILPAHDGLGMFSASSMPVQEQIWNFEQNNPRKKPALYRRRRSSVLRTLEEVEDDSGQYLENTRHERIEKWRIEQSKILLEEVEKENKRRRMSRSSKARDNTITKSPQDVIPDSEIRDASRSYPHDPPSKNEDSEESESFWQRITRRVIRDLIGIDDALLSVIFGESLPSEEDMSSTPKAQDHFPSATLASSVAKEAIPAPKHWEDQLLQRLAQQLGILVHQFTSHPSTSGTLPNPATMDYAGIPITTRSIPKQVNHHASKPLVTPQSPRFTPTLHSRQPTAPSASEHAARWGIEDPTDATSPHAYSADPEYWERTPDLKTLFSYFHHRFTSSHTSPPTKHKDLATSSTPDFLRRAAIIRQYHPLVTRQNRVQHARRGSIMSSYGAYSIPQLSAGLKRARTSCASASTKKSRRESGGSGNYWDIGGSIGSGSVGGYGGIGAWGEV